MQCVYSTSELYCCFMNVLHSLQPSKLHTRPQAGAVQHQCSHVLVYVFATERMWAMHSLRPSTSHSNCMRPCATGTHTDCVHHHNARAHSYTIHSRTQNYNSGAIFVPTGPNRTSLIAYARVAGAFNRLEASIQQLRARANGV